MGDVGAPAPALDTSRHLMTPGHAEQMSAVAQSLQMAAMALQKVAAVPPGGTRSQLSVGSGETADEAIGLLARDERVAMAPATAPAVLEEGSSRSNSPIHLALDDEMMRTRILELGEDLEAEAEVQIPQNAVESAATAAVHRLRSMNDQDGAAIAERILIAMRSKAVEPIRETAYDQ